MSQKAYQKTRVLRRPEVQERTGLSKSGLYLAIQQGEFPKQIKIGQRAVGWLETDVDEWLQVRVLRRAQA